jgi:type I restriction enzyme R subunit
MEAVSNTPVALALEIDEVVKRIAPNGWRGVQTKERVIKRALHDILKNQDEVERIFPIIKEQREY